jgi:hypothetical protein
MQKRLEDGIESNDDSIMISREHIKRRGDSHLRLAAPPKEKGLLKKLFRV